MIDYSKFCDYVQAFLWIWKNCVSHYKKMIFSYEKAKKKTLRKIHNESIRTLNLTVKCFYKICNC